MKSAFLGRVCMCSMVVANIVLDTPLIVKLEVKESYCSMYMH